LLFNYFVVSNTIQLTYQIQKKIYKIYFLWLNRISHCDWICSFCFGIEITILLYSFSLEKILFQLAGRLAHMINTPWRCQSHISIIWHRPYHLFFSVPSSLQHSHISSTDTEMTRRTNSSYQITLVTWSLCFCTSLGWLVVYLCMCFFHCFFRSWPFRFFFFAEFYYICIMLKLCSLCCKLLHSQIPCIVHHTVL
jgi:hypothetical protein